MSFQTELSAGNSQCLTVGCHHRVRDDSTGSLEVDILWLLMEQNLQLDLAAADNPLLPEMGSLLDIH